jgi:1,4-alpha-glucan branching enzyme
MVTTHGSTVEFRFFKPVAREVFLVGDFMDWQERRCPMHLNRKGEWTARIELPPGEHRFRYLADGQWFTDYAAFGLEMGPFGFDSLVRVREAHPHHAQRRARSIGRQHSLSAA